MANYVIEDNKCLVDLSSVENSRIVANVNPTTALATLFTQLGAGISMYYLSNISAGVYPVAVQAGEAVVMCINTGNTGYFVFEYGGAMYLCSVSGDTAGSWVNITQNKATADSFGVVKLTTSTDVPTGDMTGIALAGTMGYTLKQAITNIQIPVNGMFVSSTSISTAEQAHNALGYGTWDYYGQLINSTSQIVVNVFIRTT
jgi:hypothetical protein